VAVTHRRRHRGVDATEADLSSPDTNDVERTGVNPDGQSAIRRLAALVACSDDAILTKSAQGIITSWNPAAERLYGYPAEEAIGRPISILIPPSRRGEERLILRRVLGGERIDHYETERVRKDGGLIVVSLSVSPVRDVDGAIVEVSVIARDVTAVRRAERQHERLQAVTAALSGATTPSEVVDVVLDEGFAAAAADAAVVALTEPGSDCLRVIGMRGYPAHLARRMHEITLDAPLPIAEALRTGRPVWLSDPGESGRRYPQEAERFELERESALAALPLRVRGRTIGVLGLRFRRGQAIDDDDRRFMLTLADQCAQALDRARLFETEHAARRRAEHLARAGSLLADSLNPRATLEQIARLAVPELADWAFVELLRDDGAIAREAVVHRDPAKERWARELAERYPVDRNAPYGSAKVIRTGQPELIRDVSDELMRAAAVSDEQHELLREVGLASAMIVPLRARGRVLGTIALASAESGRRFTDDDLAMAQELADRCALALDNALLFAERSYIAKTLQEGLLPAALPDIPQVELAAHYRAAREQADVGGDFYDVFGAGGAWVFVIGDVVGKGAKAAAITGLARHTLRAAALYERSPAQMLRVLNRAMRDQFTDDEQFCTAAVARLHGDELCVALGGHPLPLIVRRDGSAHPVGRPGTLIGVLDEPAVSEDRVRLHRGESLVLYTDGVTDAHGSDGRFGAERLAAVLAMSLGLPPAQVVLRVDRAVGAYRAGEPTDDSAILAFRLSPRNV
jgi:PAS domain S-box-containing protein